MHYFQEEHYKQLYEAEVSDHRTTRKSLKEAERKIADLQSELTRVIQEQEAKLVLAQKEVSVWLSHDTDVTEETTDK